MSQSVPIASSIIIVVMNVTMIIIGIRDTAMIEWSREPKVICQEQRLSFVIKWFMTEADAYAYEQGERDSMFDITEDGQTLYAVTCR